MLKRIVKRFVCGHEKTVLVKVEGEGINTVFSNKCLCCGQIITSSIKVKTK